MENCEALIVNDPMMWRMYALAYGLGLRSSEIKRARWGDLMEDFDGNKLIRIHSPKSGGKWQDRPVDPAWWDKLFSNKASHDDLIVPVQEDRITKRISAVPTGCMRSGGPQTRASFAEILRA